MMERAFEAAGGASDRPVVIEDEEFPANDFESWDAAHVEQLLEGQQSCSEDLSQYEPSISGAIGHSQVGIDTSLFAGYNFQNTLRDATLSSSSALPDLPWETPTWRCIFDETYDHLESISPTRLLSGPTLPVLPRDGDELKETLVAKKRTVQSLDEKIPIFSLAVGHRRDIGWEEKRESDFQRSLMKWTGIVLAWPTEWPVCQAFSESETVVQVCEQLGHHFDGKAPATLIKRANSMIFLMEQGHKLGYMFPYTESELYSLLKVLKDTGQTASRLKGVMEALTFCRYVFNIEPLHPLTVSKRCYGAISSGPVNRANQAAPLAVRDLVKLHEILESSDDMWDRVMAGSSLFCVYARARWSDFVHCGNLSLDKLSDGSIAYVDADVSIHKTMHSAARRFRFLNLTAPGLGVHGSDWVTQWISALEHIGVDPFNIDGGCVIPAPDSEGRPLRRALESDEAGCWLRLLIGEKHSRAESSRLISSHSLKATMLSFAAKRGYSHPDRLSLGHHVHPYKMADVYARDAAARDLRLLDALIREVRDGSFRPDESRAGRLDLAKRQKVDEFGNDKLLDEGIPDLLTSRDAGTSVRPDLVAEAVDQSWDVSADVEAGGHITTDSSSSDSDEGDREIVQRQFLPPTAPDGYVFCQHHKSKLLHYMRVGDQRVLSCGRMKTQAYNPPAMLRYDSAVCHACQTAARRV